MHVCVDAQKTISDFLGLGLQAVVNLLTKKLGAKLRLSARVVCVLKHWAIYPTRINLNPLALTFYEKYPEDKVCIIAYWFPATLRLSFEQQLKLTNFTLQRCGKCVLHGKLYIC